MVLKAPKVKCKSFYFASLILLNIEKKLDFEERRRRSLCGNICMNVCYLILTLLLIMLFFGFGFDMYLKYNSEISLKEK